MENLPPIHEAVEDLIQTGFWHQKPLEQSVRELNAAGFSVTLDELERLDADRRAKYMDMSMGYPNRDGALLYFGSIMSPRVRLEDASIAVIVDDLNRFKEINDVYGHKVGDEALKHLNTSMMRVEGLEVVRPHGDEFFWLSWANELDSNGLDLDSRIHELMKRSHDHPAELLVNGERTSRRIGLSLGLEISDSTDPLRNLLFDSDDSLRGEFDTFYHSTYGSKSSQDTLNLSEFTLPRSLVRYFSLDELDIILKLKRDIKWADETKFSDMDLRDLERFYLSSVLKRADLAQIRAKEISRNYGFASVLAHPDGSNWLITDDGKGVRKYS